MEKKIQRRSEIVINGLFVILDNVSSSRSWSPEKWRLVHNRSRSVQTFRSFNQLISNHLKDFILDDIQTINFLPSRLYYMILSRSRSPKRRHQDKTASSLEREHSRGASGESARNEGWLVYFSHCIGVLVLVFLLSSVLFHNSDGVTGLFFLKHCTLLPTTLEMGKIKNWTYFYGKCPAKNAANGISVILNQKIFWGSMPPCNFSSPRT